MTSESRGRRARRAARRRDVKDRLIQTRVPERLETVLKEEAKRRRLTVSHLIRNVLEDTLDLVDTVVIGAGDLVGTSVELAAQVASDAGKIASNAREAVRSRAAPSPDSPPNPEEKNAGEEPSLEHVLAWNKVVVNRPATCARCSAELARGTSAHLGIASDPTLPPTWLCDACLARLETP